MKSHLDPLCSENIKRHFSGGGEPAGDDPDPRQVEPILDLMIWMQMFPTKKAFQLGSAVHYGGSHHCGGRRHLQGNYSAAAMEMAAV